MLSITDVSIHDEARQGRIYAGTFGSCIFSTELYPTNSEYSAMKETDLQKGDWDFGYTCMNTGILGVVNDQGGVVLLEYRIAISPDAWGKEEALMQFANGLADILGGKTSYGEEIMMNMVGITDGLEPANITMLVGLPYCYYWAEKDILISSCQADGVTQIMFMAL